MRFELTIKEIIYIKNTFGFPKLLCVEEGKSSDSVSKFLEERQIIANKGTYFELAGEYRLLFKHWSKMRFSIVDPIESASDKFYCVLANYEAIIVYRQNGENVILDYYDFDEHALDVLLASIAALNVKVECESSFVQTFSMQDFDRLINVDGIPNYVAMQRESGIPAELFEKCLKALTTKRAHAILVEDHAKGIGYLAQLANTPDGIVMLKHVTPPDKDNEKMVLVWGDAKYVVKSIYNF